MRFKKLDLNLLVALDHMLELRSVTAAAEADVHEPIGHVQCIDASPYIF